MSIPVPPWMHAALVAAILCIIAPAIRAAAADGAGSAPPQDSEHWRRLADAVFQPVAQTADIPDALQPSIMAEDSAGFLWLGGHTGLVRWDGTHFRAYGSTHGLADTAVRALHRDGKGTLWVGSSPGGLMRYDAARDTFVTVPCGAATDGVRAVWSIEDDGADGIWIGTDRGLFHHDPAGQVIAQLHHDPTRPGSLPDDGVRLLLRDSQGRLWIAGRGVLARGTEAGGPFRPVSVPGQSGEAEVIRLLLDGAGRIWIATRHDGAFVVAPTEAAAHRVRLDVADTLRDASSQIRALAEVAPGLIWLGTAGAGIWEIDTAPPRTPEPPQPRARRILRDPSVPNGLDHDIIHGLYRDRSGLVWVSTAHGLSHADPARSGLLPMFGWASRADGLNAEDVVSVLARPDGTIWAAAGSSGGIVVLGPDGKRLHTLPIRQVHSMDAAADGTVFVATESGLYSADPAGARVTQLRIPGRAPAASTYAVRVLDGIVWIGGSTDGVWALRIAGGAVAVARHADVPRLSNSWVTALGPGPAGKLAVGTGSGLDLLDPASGAIEQVQPDPSDPQGPDKGAIMSLATDRQGRLWAGTDSAGIEVMTGRDPRGRLRFRRIGLAEGLPNGDINKMLPDRLGNVWVSTDRGLARVDATHFAVTNFGPADGAAIDTFWNDSGSVAPDGTLLFGGFGGLLIVRPNQVESWAFNPRVVVTEVRVDGRPLPGAAPGVQGAGPPLQLPPTARSLTVEFAALDYSAPALNRYRYKLDGFDTGWVETDAARRLATYTNLPPGAYVLHIGGSNRRGVWSPDEIRLRITMLPAWFQTLWFHLALALAAGGAVAALVHIRTVVLRQRQRELERLVAERTTQLSARTAELTSSQQELRHFAYFDSLTALPNRRAFNEAFREAAVAASHNTGFTLVLIDLDGFKQVNDLLGHDAGDALLVLAAGCLREAVRAGDFVARLGGDEFAILLQGSNGAVWSERVCERVVTALASVTTLRGRPVKVGASLGIAACPEHGVTCEDLYKYADLALYAAKAAGRGVWRWYQPARLSVTTAESA